MSTTDIHLLQFKIKSHLLKWIILTWKNANLELVNLECVTYAQPIFLS